MQKITKRVINESNTDLILFSGNTVLNSKDIAKLENQITNKHIVAIIEVQNDIISRSLTLNYSLYITITVKIQVRALASYLHKTKNNYYLGEQTTRGFRKQKAL